MSDWLRFLIAVLATYRLAYMLAREDGPFDLFSTWREKVGQSAWYGRGFHCVLCMSFWIALPAALVAFGLSGFLAWFGVAGGVLVIFLVLERYQ